MKTFGTKTRLRMTASEIAAGRYLRAPDHDASTGGEDNSSGGEESSSTDGNEDSDAGLTTAQKLEKEFGQEITPDDDGSDDSDGSQSDEGDEGDDPEDGDGEADDGEEGDLSDEDGDDPEDGDGEADKAPKKNRAQERIDELTNQSRNHEREAAKWRQIAIDNGFNPNATEGPQLPEQPDPEKYQYGEHDPEYLKALGAYDAKVEVMQDQAKAVLNAETEALEAKWTKNLAGAAEKYPDFNEVVVKKADKWPCTPVVAIALKDSDVGPDVAYFLATHVEEAEALAKGSPLEQARNFGRLEQKFIARAAKAARRAKSEEASGNKPKETVRKQSKAPPPPKRRVSGGGASHETPADTDDFAAFERKADRIMAQQRK